MVPHGNARRLAVRAPARHNQGALEPTSPFPEDRMAVLVGKKAPEFTLAGSQGEEVSLGDFKGKSVILYFYPKDDTPGCTREACDFRDAKRKFTTARAVVLGVSPDSLKSHDKFITKFELPFTLLSDPDHALAEAYGTWVEKSMYGRKYMGIERSTFVIDPAGKVKAVFRKVKVDGHVDEVLAALKEKPARAAAR
jgi:peroxiredoxin Q/BCP